MNDKQQLAAMGDEFRQCMEKQCVKGQQPVTMRIYQRDIPAIMGVDIGRPTMSVSDLVNGDNQPLCMAKRIEELEAQARTMAGLLREARPFMDHRGGGAGVKGYSKLLIEIDAVLSGNLPAASATLTEAVRTAPDRIWLQVGDSHGDHDHAFPDDHGGVSWCDEQVMPCEVPYVRADLVGSYPTAQEGWQLVPVDVTIKMQHAYFGVIDKNMDRVNTDCRFGRYDSSKEAYRAMLAAAPKSDSEK